MLTSQWIDGCQATDVQSMKERGLPLAEVADKVTKAFSEQLFITGFIHGDPHPGNGISYIVILATKSLSPSRFLSLTLFQF